jgi:medium-chain acyl-[acyl-carrier-protein] hydrolase
MEYRMEKFVQVNGVNPSTKSWFVCFRPNPKASIRLFCFPYAGGGAAIYNSWLRRIPESVELFVAQLPGRGSRTRETPFTNAYQLVEEMAAAIKPHTDRPFAFFGHSMGAILAFELAHQLRQNYGLEACHLFLSGRGAPQFPDADKKIYQLPEPEFLEELRRLNGTPREVLEHAELMQLLIPILRADFEVCQTYVHTPKPPLNCSITAFGGLQDGDVTREHLAAWRGYTKASFALKMLPGGHFFLNSSEAILLEQLSKELLRVIALQKADQRFPE